MSLLANRVLRGYYQDSVALMRVSRAVADVPGVLNAALMIGSASNKEILETSSLLGDDGRSAVANDLVIAVRAQDQASLDAALALADQLLNAPLAAERAGNGEYAHVRRLDSALARQPGSNLALISVPGEFAAQEARKALTAGLHVVMFSDNVPIEAEVELKRYARERHLLMMGPDCGTCLINGAPIAFANAVPRGDIGLVSASGTGLQEVSTLIARGGRGISHGIGVGGRDLSEKVGGITTLMAIDALESDPATDRIVLISKPPAADVMRRVVERIGACTKPVVVGFMGCRALDLPPNARLAVSLRQIAEQCLGDTPIEPQFVARTKANLARRAGFIRGLFCGGTLCAEAQSILLAAGVPVQSNVPVPGAARMSGEAVRAHTLVDLGDDEYTRGRPHPMIEPAIRTPALRAALRDPDVAAVLLDVVIGYGADDDPAGAVAEVLSAGSGSHPPVIASVCGTEGDPQGYSRQRAKLEAAGVIVAPSNAHAAELAAHLAGA